MVENHQDKRESKLPATEDKLQPLSSKDQREPDRPQNNRMRTIILRLGVFGYDKETKEYTPDGQLAKITKEYQPGKTFWDWLQLLIIPLLLASATIGFGWWQVHLADLQHQNDLTIANDQQQEATLKTYLDDMTTLLLDKKLGSQTAADKAASAEAAIVARAKTLLVLRRLADPLRKATVVQFLYEAHLISYLSSDATPVRYVIDLTNADLTNARLSDADLSGAHLQGAQLTNADLTNADLQGADLLDADLQGADLTNANLTNARLSSANLTNAHLTLALLQDANLTNARLSDADLGGADLQGADLTMAFLAGADLRGADLFDANLGGAHLFHALLGGAHLTNANLSGADLRGAHLQGADLQYAHLTNADLQGADLLDADLGGADLQGADLTSANLSGAQVTAGQLAQAKSLKGATMFDGSIHP